LYQPEPQLSFQLALCSCGGTQQHSLEHLLPQHLFMVLLHWQAVQDIPQQKLPEVSKKNFTFFARSHVTGPGKVRGQ